MKIKPNDILIDPNGVEYLVHHEIESNDEIVGIRVETEEILTNLYFKNYTKKLLKLGWKLIRNKINDDVEARR